MAFDVMSEAVSETATLDLDKADGEPMFGDGDKRCSITLYGPASDEFAAMQARQRKRSRERLSKGKTDVAAETQKRESAEDLASITKSFNHFTFPGEFKSQGEMFEACYLERKVGFIADQANMFVSDWGNFSGASAKK